MCARVDRGGGNRVRAPVAPDQKGARDCGGGWVGEWAPGLGGNDEESIPLSPRKRFVGSAEAKKVGVGRSRTATSPSQVAETCGCGRAGARPSRGPAVTAEAVSNRGDLSSPSRELLRP